MLLQILLCAGISAALLCGLWLLAARMLLPFRTKDVFLVLAASGDGAALEQEVRAYLLLRNAGALQRPLLIADCGLNEEGRQLCDQLSRLDDAIRCCSPSEMQGLLTAEQQPFGH